MTLQHRHELVSADRESRSALRELPLTDVLLLAPPGCGKTEGLADRAQALIRSGIVEPPTRILGLTFSNRARDSLKERLASKVGSRSQRITVTNLHGLSSRLIRSHGRLLNIDQDWVWPQRGWRRRLLSDVSKGNPDRRDRIESSLRQAKSSGSSDDEVRRCLEELRADDALQFEIRRVADHRLDYQDLLRHAQRLLQFSQVRHVYRLHFVAMLLDEAQDLTLQQLEIALSLGEGRITTAIDMEQGIYSFAGANPEAALERLRSLEPVELQLHLSFRSTDAVLGCINALSETGTSLVSAESQRSRDQGLVSVVRTQDKGQETANVLECVGRLTRESPNLSIGLLSRDRYRRDFLVRGLAESDIDHVLWDRPTDNPVIGRLLKGCLADVREGANDYERLAELIGLARLEIDPADAELLDELVEVEYALTDLLRDITLECAVERCRREKITRAVQGGVHVVIGHAGKGQQFDWVFVIGLEEGILPHHRARTPQELAEEKRVLRVMASRARYGVVFTFVSGWRTKYDTWRVQDESRWLSLIDQVATHDWDGLLQACTGSRS